MSTENVAANNPGQSVTQVTGLECEPCRRLIIPVQHFNRMDLVVEAVKIEKHQQEATSKTIAQAGAAALRQRRQWLVLESDLRPPGLVQWL